MARVKLELPGDLDFEARLKVRITDINYGNHLGNHALLGLLHEARLQFFARYGFTELDAGGTGIIMTDTVVIFKSEVFYGQELVVRVGAADPGRSTCDICYQVTDAADGAETARAKTGIAFFDYEKKAMSRMPAAFREALFPSA